MNLEMNTKNTNRKEVTVDNYIVRIYRRKENIRQTRGEAAAHPQRQSLNGVVEVETSSGVRYVFASAQELWRILVAEPPGGDRQPDAKPWLPE
jgi:hypothetical protein